MKHPELNRLHYMDINDMYGATGVNFSWLVSTSPEKNGKRRVQTLKSDSTSVSTDLSR